jgi:hypothetical protein
MYPLEHLTRAVTAFQAEFPTTPLTLYVEALGAVLQPVMDGRCAFGVMGSLPTAPSQLTRERLFGVRMLFVSSPLRFRDRPVTGNRPYGRAYRQPGKDSASCP